MTSCLAAMHSGTSHMRLLAMWSSASTLRKPHRPHAYLPLICLCLLPPHPSSSPAIPLPAFPTLFPPLPALGPLSAPLPWLQDIFGQICASAAAAQLEQSRVTFTKALDNLIVIASLQTAFVALDEARRERERWRESDGVREVPATHWALFALT